MELIKTIKEEMHRNKCAEIFCLNSHLEVMCSYCFQNYSRMQDFCKHLFTEHLSIENQNFIEQFLIVEEVKTNDTIQISSSKLTDLNDTITPSNVMLTEINEIKYELKNLDESFTNDTVKGIKKRSLRMITKTEILEKFTKMEDGRYSCKICNRISKKYNLQTHLKSHDKSRYKYQCNICLKLFIFEGSLNMHIKNFHEGDKPYKCEHKNCNKTFVKENNLREHLKYHAERPFKCFICFKDFVYETKLKAHSLTHYRTRKRRKEIVSQENQAIDNININNVENNLNVKTETNNSLENGSSANEKRFKQTQMLKIKKSKTLVKKEIDKVICDVCGKTTSKYKLTKHLESHDETRYLFQCDNCKKKFISEKSLDNHIKAIHKKELPFTCSWNDCDKRFANRISLNVHMRRHTSDRPFKCEICSKGFIYECRRDQHYKIYHVNGRIFKCDICDKRFYEQHNLNKHKIIHSNEKPYACNECPAKFLRERCLQWHKKQHSGIKDYVCKICGKGYALYNGIYSHMKTHGIKYSLDYEKGLTDGKS